VESSSATPRIVRAAAFGLAAAAPVALVYGILADPFGLSWGLIVVGLLGGSVIGMAVAYGAWGTTEHQAHKTLRWMAAAIAMLAWVAASVVAYVGSQIFYLGATTPLADRVSVAGFVDYFGGTLISPSLIGLAAMAFMAWRGAR
jgi:hypothetical protein